MYIDKISKADFHKLLAEICVAKGNVKAALINWTLHHEFRVKEAA